MSAATNWAEAQARVAHLAGEARAADAELTTAVAARDALINGAAAGTTVTAADMRRAESHVRDREGAATLARAVLEGARKAADIAEIAALAEAADALSSRRAGMLAAVREAALAVDAATQAAREALDDMRAKIAALGDVGDDISVHAARLEDAARRNSALATAHRSTWPKAAPLPGLSGISGFEIALLRPANVPMESADGRMVRGAVGALVPAA